MSRAQDLLCTEDCGTKRTTMVAGKVGTPVTYLTGLKCTYPVSSERYFSQGHTQEREWLHSPYESMVAMLQGSHDITKHDFFVWNSKDWSIEHVERRPMGTTGDIRTLIIFYLDAT